MFLQWLHCFHLDCCDKVSKASTESSFSPQSRIECTSSLARFPLQILHVFFLQNPHRTQLDSGYFAIVSGLMNIPQSVLEQYILSNVAFSNLASLYRCCSCQSRSLCFLRGYSGISVPQHLAGCSLSFLVARTNVSLKHPLQ